MAVDAPSADDAQADATVAAFSPTPNAWWRVVAGLAACLVLGIAGMYMVLLFLGSRPVDLRDVLRRAPFGREQSWPPLTITLFIGPEGGFTPGEVRLAQRYGLVPLTLGPRILRAETAGLVAASAILYELGDLA